MQCGSSRKPLARQGSPYIWKILYIYIYISLSLGYNSVVRNLFSESTPTILQVCSDINKPNGQFVLQNDRSTVMTFISSLPIRKVCDP